MECTGLNVQVGGPTRAPGTLKHHYAPEAGVVLVEPEHVDRIAGDLDPTSTGFLALADLPTPPGLTRLASPTDSDAYAQQLYAALRRADDLGLRTVIAVPPPQSGVGVAVRERLERAAAATQTP
jgi:L-threonylcarbamoyladenylate synthase